MIKSHSHVDETHRHTSVWLHPDETEMNWDTIHMIKLNSVTHVFKMSRKFRF